MLKPNIQNDTALRVQKLTGQPLTKGFDKQVNALCNELEQTRNQNNENEEKENFEKLDCMCDNSQEVLNQNG